MNAPLHVSATWGSVSELWATVAEAALFPGTASPRTEPETVDRTNLWIAGTVAGELSFLLSAAGATTDSRQRRRRSWWVSCGGGRLSADRLAVFVCGAETYGFGLLADGVALRLFALHVS
jgi:hypothetical protein